MMTFRKRMWRSLLLTALVAIVLIVVVSSADSALLPTIFFTGWTLFVLLILLASYNLRKKLTMLPIGSSSLWLQFHIYLGVLMVVMLPLHTGLNWPQGPLERSLGLVFFLVAGSGLLGLLLSRTMPSRLTVHGEEVIFERIPIFRKEIREEAVRQVIAAGNEGHTTVVDFYQKELTGFFLETKHFFYHLVQSRRPIHRLVRKLDALGRYMNDEEKAIAVAIKKLMLAKNNLDYFYSLQVALKGWLFFHIPLTYMLFLLAVVHGFVAHAFFQR